MKLYYQEPHALIYQGHALDVLKGMSAESVDCVPTSPPYWGLRTYKTEPIVWGDNHCEHEWGEDLRQRQRGNAVGANALINHEPRSGIEIQQGNFCLKCGAWRGELGLEPTIELYISHLLQIFDEVKRVLKKTGTCWVNIGDSYNSAAWGDSKTNFRDPKMGNKKAIYADGIQDLSRTVKTKNLQPKSLCLIPERFAIGMVERGWILRNNIIWYKSNPMPESCKDRFTGTYEYLYFFVKNKKYWFEQQFEPMNEGWENYAKSGLCQKQTQKKFRSEGLVSMTDATMNPLGRNKRDVWEINTEPYPEAHFATFPEKLVETPILAGCPSAICKKCGKAREKIYKDEREYQARNVGGKSQANEWQTLRYKDRYNTIHVEQGYTDCGCNEGFETGVVLDPFAGSGATGAVAKRFARKYIGIELNPEYCKLHKKRLQAVPLAMEFSSG